MTLKEISEEVKKRIGASYKAFYLACREDDDAQDVVLGATAGRADSAYAEWSYAYGCVTAVGGCFPDAQFGDDKSLGHAVEVWQANRWVKVDADAVCAAARSVLGARGSTAADKVARLCDELSTKISRVKAKSASVYVIRDAHILFEAANRGDASACRDVAALKGFIKSFDFEDPPADESPIVFLLGQDVKMPAGIEPYLSLFKIVEPAEQEIAELIQERATDMKADVAGKWAKQFRGLGRRAVCQLLVYISRGGSIDKDAIYREKKQEIQKSRVLDLVDVNIKGSDVGGLDLLMEWLRGRGNIVRKIEEAESAGVDTPKGALIVGMPGCGKSLAAKATANILGVQLLRMDMGSLMGKYVGESEENMRRALQLASAASPCVLWVDEIEKAFAGVSSGNGGSEIATRLFGYFLTWMQEKTEPVFVVATANRIDLPPELFRRGRFDDIFYVDFPNKDEAASILKLHLNKRLNKKKAVVSENVLKKVCANTVSKLKGTKGELVYAGSDIEALASTAVERLFTDHKPVKDLEKILDEIIKEDVIRPIGETMKDEIKTAREKFRKMGLRPASK